MLMILALHGPAHAEYGSIGGGILTDQTYTTMGHAFYQAFAATWRERDGNGKYSLSIGEKPSALQGSLISIDYGQKRVFQARIPRNIEQIRKLADRVANGIFDDVSLSEVSSMLFRDADLAREEL